MNTIIAATNRPRSYTLKLASYYQELLASKGCEAKVLSLTQLPKDLLCNDLYDGRSPQFMGIQKTVTATKKFIFVVPEYNGSFPGVLKLFIDACKFPESFFGKKAALVGLSGGKYGNVRGIEHLTGILHYINMFVLPLRLHIPMIKKEFDEHDKLFQEETLNFINDQIRRFIDF